VAVRAAHLRYFAAEKLLGCVHSQSHKEVTNMAVNNYEAMMIFSLKDGEEAVNALKERFQTLIEQNGTMTEVKEWGKRVLKYLIEKQSEGFYVLYKFSAAPEFPAEFERHAGISDGVLRLLITREGE